MKIVKYIKDYYIDRVVIFLSNVDIFILCLVIILNEVFIVMEFDLVTLILTLFIIWLFRFL